jgi:hypothetical protein
MRFAAQSPLNGWLACWLSDTGRNQPRKWFLFFNRRKGSLIVEICVCFRHSGEPSKVGAFASRHLRFDDCRATALSKKRSNLIIRALRPFVGLRQPKCSTISVEQGALSAHHFLIANFGKLVDLPSLPKRKAIYRHNITEL